MALTLTEPVVIDKALIADAVSAFEVRVAVAGGTLVTLSWARASSTSSTGWVAVVIAIAAATSLTATVTRVVTLLAGVIVGAVVLAMVTSANRWSTARAH
jgi:hypothetical protein